MKIKSDKEKTALLEAKNWFLKMNFEKITPEIQAKFKAWLDEDSLHKSKFDLIHATWESSTILENHPVVIREMSKGLDKQRFKKIVSWFQKPGIRPNLLKPIAVFTSVLLVVLGIWFMQGETDRSRMYHTGTGEQRKVFVPDGSLIFLDAESVLTARITKTQRWFELEKGRASFSVFHNPERPFIVTSGRAVIRAIGTKFNVHKEREGKVVISVTEGSVKVSQKEKRESNIGMEKSKSTLPSAQSVEKMPLKTGQQNSLSIQIVDSGQQVIVDNQETNLRVKSIDIEIVDSWKNGKLFFFMRPLSEVVEEINRYLEHKIEFDDESVGDIRISLDFDIQHLNNFLAALQKAIPEIYYTNFENRIVLNRVAGEREERQNG